MASSPDILLPIAGTIVLLALLVWLMARRASGEAWKEASAAARASRNRLESE